ncbi:MAG: HPr(Ser) kinase/phosphatase [Eubacteriales bacterium]|nr:HPr(Ser) kinase/phosphatase [Eubacteriales bacterium]
MTEMSFSVPLSDIIRQFSLEEVYLPCDPAQVQITSTDVLRPGLQLTGYFDHYDSTRIQIVGMVEYSYIKTLPDEQVINVFEALFSTGAPALVLTRGLEVVPGILQTAKAHNIPILRTEQSTSAFMSALIAYLNKELAPRITRHGVLVEIYGEGVLILGESGIGKSEIAIELVKRGHRLVADDAVDIRKVSAISLIGSSPKVIRHFIELRGIGIIDVKRIFGIGAVKDTEKIDLIIHLESWQQGKAYDRLGLVDEYTNLLGIDIPSLVVPVSPGRNLAVILEVAAMNIRQKRMGYNAAEALNNRLIAEMNGGNQFDDGF